MGKLFGRVTSSFLLAMCCLSPVSTFVLRFGVFRAGSSFLRSSTSCRVIPSLGQDRQPTPFSHNHCRLLLASTDESDITKTDSPEVDGVVTELSASDLPIDLAKDIDFEPPQSKVEEKDKEEGTSQSRVILYVVLSLIPCLFLLPFLGSNEFVPVDPNQM